MYFVNQLNQTIRNTEAINKQQSKRRITIHSTKSRIPAAKKGKFVFEPPKAIQSQIDSFFLMCKRNNWDRKLAIKGYKGTFKVEHFIMIETQLRILWPLRELDIIDTQMDREHLIILRQWLSWLEPEKLTLEFQQNEIDDLDFEEFLYFIFERGIDLKRLFIISNPGIYKGQLIKQLSFYLDKKYKKNEIFEYKLIKNKDSKSIAIIRIQKDWNEKEIQSQLEQAREKIDQTCFYNFNLTGCFTKKNYKGFEHLIQLTYDLDNLEQISGLDLSDNYLGTMNSFATTCSHISTAKGLLELRLRGQELIVASTTVVPLMGDRYDKLRVNILDLGGNSDILEKTFKIFSDEIFLHCKEIILTEVLTQQLSTLYKLSVMTQAFQERSQYLKQLQSQNGKKKMHNFKIFDLATVENYNRHDLVEKFLKNVIFSEYSNLKKLIIQNLDIGRAEAYIKQIQLFKEQIAQQQLTNPDLKNFKLPLKEITLPNQSYRMEILTMKKFFLEYFFTKKGNVIEIETFKMIRCFRQTNREEGIKETCEEIYNDIQEGKNTEVEYTMKHIHIQDTTCNMSVNMYKCFLLTNQFHLQCLTIIDEGWDDEFDTCYTETINFLAKQPSNFIHSLHTLILCEVTEITIDVYKFAELFIYNPQIRLKKLQLQKLDLNLSEEQNFTSLSEEKHENFTFSLQELTLGSLNDQDLEIFFFEYVILTKYCKIDKLTLNKFQFQEKECLKIKKKYQALQESTHNPFQNLTFLKFDEAVFTNPLAWDFFMENIIFHEKSALKELYLKKLVLDVNFKQSIEKATSSKAEQIAALYQKIQQNEDMSHQAMISLRSLAIEDCECKCEIFTNLFPICILKELKFINCSELEQSLKQTMEIHDKEEILQTYNRFTIETFTLQDCLITDLNIFKWLIGDIIFNEDMQQVKHITLSDCQLTDEHLHILAKIIDKIKTQSLVKRRYYNLRTIDLSKNANICENRWIDFFDKLMEQKRNKIENEQDQEEKSKQNEKLEVQPIIYNQESDDEKDIMKLASENCDFVTANELNVKGKVITNFEIFKPSYPTTLQNLTITLSFSNFSDTEKDLAYYRIIAGFIINPDSHVNQLKLQDVDMNCFMKNVTKAQTLISLLFQNYHQKDAKQFKIKLRELEFILEGSGGDSIKEDVQQFVETFICSNHVDLAKLTLENFNNIGLVSQILGKMQNKSEYFLEELTFTNIKEQLTEIETFAFISKIMLNQVLPLKSLKLCKDIVFADASISELLFEQPSQYLEAINFKIPEEQGQKQIYCKVLELLLTNCKLKKIDLTFSEIINEFFEPIIDKIITKEYQLEEIILQGTLKLDNNWLRFIYKNLKTIKLLQIKELTVNNPEELQEFIASENVKFNQRQSSSIDIQLIKGDEGIQLCYDSLIFNHNFGFERVILRNHKNFSFLKEINNYQNIKQIKIDMGLIYNSSEQLDEDALTLFASKFIYNEESQCEDLMLWQCHFKVPCLKALIKPAEQFRKQIKDSNRQSIAQLKLKRFTLYYSLYMGNEGHQLVIKELCFFDYISLEKIVFQVTNFNNENCMAIVNSSKKWLAFQKEHQSEYQVFPLKYLDVARNEFISEENVWHEFLTTLVFSDNVPYLETCNFHFMAINDIIAEFIVKDALMYLNRKPKNFKHPLKKLNFQLNNSLTKFGWANIFKNFFLHPKIDLIELNMISTMLDSQEKLDVIYECFVERANMYPDKKLPMQAFLCYNCTLKDMIFPYITPMPKDYKEPNDLAISIDYKSWRFGIHDGIPEEFGAKILTYNRILTFYEEFIETNKWRKYEDIKFSPFQLSFTEHYLKILNNHYKSANQKQIQIFLNLANLNNFCSIFKYNIDRPGEPYPYKLVLQKDTYQFLKSRQSHIYKFCFLQIEFPNLEIIKQKDILDIWKQVKSWRSSIDQIQIEYSLTDELCEEMFRQGYTERDILSLIRIIPPKSVRLQGGLSLPAVKGLYSILYDTHYFQYSIVNYGFDTFLNTGIGYALRESAYNYRDNNQVTFILKRTFYKIYNFFVSKTEKYMFNDETIQLNNFLSQKKKYFSQLLSITFFFGLQPSYLPIFSLISTTVIRLMQNTHNIAIQELAKRLVGCIMEVYLFYWFQMQIPSHVEKIEIKIEEDNQEEQEKKKLVRQHKNQVTPLAFIQPEKDYSPQLNATFQPLVDIQKKEEEGPPIIQQISRTKKEKPSEHFTEKISKTIKTTYKYFQLQSKKIAESKYIELINHMVGLVLSQLYKFDLYNDVVFILTCFYCNERILFILALIITAITQGIQFVQFLYLFYVRLTQTETTAKILSTKFINDIYAIAFLGRNQAITNQLDRVAPYNVSIIPNNWLTRRLLPNQAGKSMSNPVKAYFMQFMLEDLPQTILQAYFAIKRALMTGGLSSQVYLIIITSIYNFLSSFYLFMSIRPSTLSQDEFDALSNRKRKLYHSIKKQQLQEEKKQLQTYQDLFSQQHEEQQTQL